MSNEPKTEIQGMKIVSLFDQGKKFTENLLRENERLRSQVKKTNHENELLTKRCQVDGIEHMQNKIKVLEEEVMQLKTEVEQQKEMAAEIEEENREFADKYVEVERQNSNLINMYVASYQLHSTLNFKNVVTIVKDITINMLGAEVFGLYLFDEKTNELILAEHEELPDDKQGNLTITEDIQRILEGSVETDMEGRSLSELDWERPIAHLPLALDNRPVGLIIVYKLLIQKGGLKEVDFDLIELLGKHAATAIYGAQLHAVSERKRSTLEGVIELLKQNN